MNASTIDRLLDEAVQAERQRLKSHARALTDSPPLPRGGRSKSAAAATPFDTARTRDALLGLLQAFIDAAQPAGGLPMQADGRPVALEALIAKGHAHARTGDTNPRLLAKVRAGKPVDLRLAEAVAAFFRVAQDRPSFSLDQLGAVESERWLAVRQTSAAIRTLRDDLPSGVLEGLARRAEEAAGYSQVLDPVRFEYSAFTHGIDAHGVHRIRLSRRIRYRPLRLVSFPGRLQPTRSLEWHEWTRLESTRLTIRLLAEDGQIQAEVTPPLFKRIDPALGFGVISIDPAAEKALLPLLATKGAGQAGPQHEVTWDEVVVFNAVDRDIVVSYYPMNNLEIIFDAAANPGFELRVGDSPGLVRTGAGWRLDRSLLPREVLAVRLRIAAMAAADVARLGASGEWRDPIPMAASGQARQAGHGS